MSDELKVVNKMDIRFKKVNCCICMLEQSDSKLN